VGELPQNDSDCSIRIINPLQTIPHRGFLPLLKASLPYRPCYALLPAYLGHREISRTNQFRQLMRIVRTTLEMLQTYPSTGNFVLTHGSEKSCQLLLLILGRFSGVEVRDNDYH
jgi:hypothetical protein